MTLSQKMAVPRKSAFYGQVPVRVIGTSNVYEIGFSDKMYLKLCEILSYTKNIYFLKYNC